MTAIGQVYWKPVSKKVKSLTCVRVFVTPWTVTYQAPRSMGFSRHRYWSGLPFPSPRDFPNPGIEPRSSALQAGTLLSEPLEKTIMSVVGSSSMAFIVLVYVSFSVVSDSLRPHGLWPARLLCLWESPGTISGVDCHSLWQRNFPTQGSNPDLLHRRQVRYRLSYREVLKRLAVVGFDSTPPKRLET